MKKTILNRFALLAAYALYLAANVQASELVWTNANSSSWSYATNWSPNQVPGTADNAYITNNGTYTVTLDVSITNATLIVGGTSGTQTLAVQAQT